MPSYPLPSLAVQITAAGPIAPSFAEILQSMQATFKSIYGTDSYIEPDSQDGQLLAAFCQGISDCNDAAIAIYNSFSPSTSRGVALSNNVKINGIARQKASRSTAVVRVVGVIGTPITGGVISDVKQQRWRLPVFVTIPSAGFIDVEATAEQDGALEADPNTITEIVTPTRGWQTVTNPQSATPGAPIESDAALRRRQTVSTALPSRTVLDGIVGAIANLAGVQEVVAYENDTDAPDSNGLPEHSISLVVTGGDPQEIGDTIARKKTPGAYTHGTTIVNTVSATGVPAIIRYFVTSTTDVMAKITIKARTGYSALTGEKIKVFVAAYINGLGTGKRVDQGKIYLPAQFYGGVDPATDLIDPALRAASKTFEVNEVLLGIVPGPPVDADVDIAFNSRAVCDVDNIELVVVP